VFAILKTVTKIALNPKHLPATKDDAVTWGFSFSAKLQRTN
jgi:hypothetical protein